MLCIRNALRYIPMPAFEAGAFLFLILVFNATG